MSTDGNSLNTTALSSPNSSSSSPTRPTNSPAAQEAEVSAPLRSRVKKVFATGQSSEGAPEDQEVQHLPREPGGADYLGTAATRVAESPAPSPTFQIDVHGRKTSSDEPLTAEPLAAPAAGQGQGTPAAGVGGAAAADTVLAASPTDAPAETSVPPAPSNEPAPVATHVSPADIERELSAAFGEESLDKLLKADVRSEVELESRVQAVVVRADREHVFLSLGGRCEGVAPLRQFATPPAPGTQVEVVVRSYNAEDHLYEVTVPGAAQEVADWSDLVEGALVEARVTGANTGGLECMVGHIRGFIPASQIALHRVERLGDYIGQKFLCVVTEVHPRKKKLVLSRRAVLEREKEEARRAQLEALQPGDVVEGVVRSIQKFGVFVDLGGLDGLIHVSQLSWEHVEDPAEVVEVGQRVRVRIERIDRQTGKIGLSLRSLQEHPWERAAQLFPVGAVVKGTVTRIAKFGAFVKLAPAIEGLLHISELAHQRVPHVGAVLQEGQEIEVKVISLDVESQRIGLSLKALVAPPPPEPEAQPESPAEPRPREPQKRPPLKGGVDRSSGGERFGLRW